MTAKEKKYIKNMQHSLIHVDTYTKLYNYTVCIF